MKNQTLPTIVKHECSFSVSNMCMNKYKVILSALIWVNKDIYRIHVLWLCSITKHLHRLLKMDCEFFDNHEQLKQFEKSCSKNLDIVPVILHLGNFIFAFRLERTALQESCPLYACCCCWIGLSFYQGPPVPCHCWRPPQHCRHCCCCCCCYCCCLCLYARRWPPPLQRQQ